MTIADAAEGWRRVFLIVNDALDVNDAFERRSHARCACGFAVFAFLLRAAMSYQGINKIRVEN
jgi:hypothetical protein